MNEPNMAIGPPNIDARKNPLRTRLHLQYGPLHFSHFAERPIPDQQGDYDRDSIES